MNKLELIKSWHLFTLSLVVAIIFIAKHQTTHQQNNKNINLSTTGVVADFTFEAKTHFNYQFSISFKFPENNQIERARVRKLLGGHALNKAGTPTEPGIPTPIRLVIFFECKNGKEIEISSEERDPILTSWGKNDFTKKITTQTLLPGTYRIQLINLRSSPELADIRTTLEVGMPANTKFILQNKSVRSNPCQQ